MVELSTNDVLLSKKVSTVLTLMSENLGNLSDDTYTEKLVTEFGRKLADLRKIEPELCFQFWISSGSKYFVRNLFSDENSEREIENFGLKLLSECVQSDNRISEEAVDVLQRFVRF